MASDRTDEELMERYRQGDRAAFTELFDRLSPRVYALLLRGTGGLPGNRALSEDLLQQTWLQVHRARDTFRRGERVAPWVFTIANNLRRDAARARGRDRAQLTSDGETPDVGNDESHSSEEAERVREALSELPEPQREVLVMHRWLDLGFAEIASIVGASEAAVRVRAHRAYEALRMVLTRKDSQRVQS